MRRLRFYHRILRVLARRQEPFQIAAVQIESLVVGLLLPPYTHFPYQGEQDHSVVEIAGVAYTVEVKIRLTRVSVEGAVIADVPDSVAIDVSL